MKKLICAKDVETAQKQGEKIIYIDSDTIVTPSAKDAARLCEIKFSTEAPICKGKSSCEGVSNELAKGCDSGIDSDMVYNLLKTMMDKGLLNGVLDSLVNPKPYVSESDCCGLKIVRGNSIKYEALDTGNSANKVFYQEIINADDNSSMNAGFITIEECTFDWETACQELYYIVEGTLKVTADGKVYTANQGDSVFFPKGAKLKFGSEGKMKAFYATY